MPNEFLILNHSQFSHVSRIFIAAGRLIRLFVKMATIISESFGVLITSSLNAIAQVSIGRGFLHLVDRSLWFIEKTAQLSIPPHVTVSNGEKESFEQIEIVRPLSWFFFLPGVVILKTFRATWNIGAWIFGYSKAQPRDLVKSVQNIRRRLRAIKTNAIKAGRQQTPKREGRSSTPTGKSSNKSELNLKRKHIQIISDDEYFSESDEETLQAKIERLALESSVDDYDFVLETCSTPESTSESNDDTEISGSEVESLRKS